MNDLSHNEYNLILNYLSYNEWRSVFSLPIDYYVSSTLLADPHFSLGKFPGHYSNLVDCSAPQKLGHLVLF